MAIPKNDKNEAIAYKYSGDEPIYEELYSKCEMLQSEKNKMLRIRENLLILNENNEIISKRLLRIKNDSESYKSQLYKTLFNLKVSADKQKILSKKNLDEFLEKTQNYQEYSRVSPKHELEELLKINLHLQQECENKADLLKLTRKQHIELRNLIIRTFQKKICEFCDVVRRLQANN